MNPQPTDNVSPVLKNAWQRYAEFDLGAVKASAQHLRLRWWILALGVLATLLAVLSDLYGEEPGLTGRVLGLALVLIPLVASALTSFANRLQRGEYWLALRAGAEEIKKEIYLYRTLLQVQPDRDSWLNDRLAEIQRRVFETAGGQVNRRDYSGPLPPYHNPADRDSDPGFNDLLPEEYLRFRLRDQLRWHKNSAARLQRLKTRLQAAVFAFSGLSTVLAAAANIPQFSGLAIWVAFTTALATAFTSWLELRRVEATIDNYHRVVLELNLIQDHWKSLPPARRSGDEFFKLVLATERVLWSQHSRFIAEMRKAVAELRGESTDTLDKVAGMPAPAAIDEAVLAQAMQKAGPAEAEAPEPMPRPGAPHALALLPAGRLRRSDGRWLDFDAIYRRLVRPALIQAGFTPLRLSPTDNGHLAPDLFQELLLSDLVVADLSLDQADTFYALGVRHALRKGGILHIYESTATLPLNLVQPPASLYHCDEFGKPDPQHRQTDIDALAELARAARQSASEQGQSPIYALLTGLSEPDRSALSTPDAVGFWREYQDWKMRVNAAREQHRVGDILLLTEEISNPVVREQAIAEAGQILSGLGYHHLALQQYRRGLELNPENRAFQREEAFELGRLGQTGEAIARLERLLADTPADAETQAFMGRLYKAMWRQEWEPQAELSARLKAAQENSYLLQRSLDYYLSGYAADQNHYYSGINAVTLASLALYLAHKMSQSDPQTAALKQQLPALVGAVKFALAQADRRRPGDYWVKASQAELAVCTAARPEEVNRLYRQALVASNRPARAIRSSIEQLEMLAGLHFRPAHVQAGLDVLKSALDKEVEPPPPEQVFLFSGHMIDQPDRPEPRFPPGMETEARQKIEDTLTRLQAGPVDRAITAGAACGGDILFIEACLRRGMSVDVYLPFPEAHFIQESVQFAGEEWVNRFHTILQHSNVTVHRQPEQVGPVPDGDNPYARNNRWALYNALAFGFERVRLIVLWNGQGGDGPGGTRHMVEEVKRLGGIVIHLDTAQFEYWQKEA